MDPISLKRDSGVIDAPSSPGEDGLYLHISNPCVVDLPEEGLITFRYTRGDLRLVKSKDETTASTDLNLTEIVDCKAEDCEDEEESEGSKLDELFEQVSKEEPEETD